MIKNLKPETKKNDTKLLVMIIVGFLFIVWLCTPPGNKFMQICFWGNNTKFMIAKMQNKDETTAYKFYRNNAIYLAKMEMKDQALKEMDKAIESLPAYMPDSTLESLYKDRAQLKLFYRDYKGALNDYTKVSSSLDFNDYFKLAMLYKVNGNNKHAAQYCNKIIATDSTAYSGYLCLADVYAGIGRPDASVRIFDLLIDRVPGRAKYYADRAGYKLKMGDQKGNYDDMEKAKELAPSMDFDSSLVQETLEPKILTLTIN